MRFTMFRGLRFHLLLLVLLASVPSFMLVAGLSIQRRRADTSEVQATSVRVAMLASTELDSLIASTRNLLVGLSQAPDVRSAGPSCERVMRMVHSQSPIYTVMGVAMPDGRFVCSSIPSPVVDLSDRRHFRAAVDQKALGIGDFVIGRASGKASLNIAMPILDDTSDVMSVVIAAIDLEAIGQMAARANLPEGSTLKVLDPNGTVLAAYPPGNGVIGQSIAEHPLFLAIKSSGGEGATETSGLDGRARLYTFQPLAPSEARSPTVVVGIPTEVAYGPANLMLAQGIMALIFIGGLALLIAWLSGEAIILKRVERILHATRRLAAGDLGARTGVTRNDGELGELAKAFDIMAYELQRRDEEHHALEHSLEEGRSRLERESERLLTLHRVSAQLSGDTLDVNTVLDEVLQSAVALVGAGDGATFHVWDEDTQRLRRVRAWGIPAEHASLPLRPGEGIVGQVFASGEALIVNDYPAWSGAAPSGRASKVRRALAVPMRHAGHRIGVLMVGANAEDERPFDADDVRLVGLLADQAAATLETTRLYVGIAAQLSRMHALTRLNQVIFSTLDRKTVLAEIARAAAEIFEAPFVAFWVLDPETQTLKSQAFSDDEIGLALRSRTLTLFEAGFGDCVPDAWTHVEIADAVEDQRIAMPSWWARHGLKTYYGVPIVGDDRQLLGLLALYGTDRFHFSEGDRDLLDSFVALAAVAVRNAFLYEAETVARQLAEQANRSKSEFLSRMSHELRTPLNAILGFAQILGMARLEARDAEAVGHILHAGKHLLGLIDDVLDIERIEAGRLPINLEPLPVADLVGELLDLVQPTANGRSVTIRTYGLDELSVLGDRQHLRQVLLNLLSNAVKYNHEGGRVTLSAEPVDGEQVKLAVRDTGDGISQERMRQLFNPFDRLGAERTGVQGTGLGLVIARSLTEAMGGEIGVESTVGQGTTFWVQLPLAANARPTLSVLPPTTEDPAPAPPTLRQSILYVEDNRPNALLVERSLAWRPQVRLLTAETASEGLALARAQHPLLILADLHLPDMSGAELLAELRSAPDTAHIPVVVLSADANREQIDRLLAAGAHAYLTKPFDVRAFLGIVDRFLQEAS
ncbi:MAG: GAF domain-containing protein [Chloroflexi bacterium]|nr:GAF domain-containing protein [Chloroflexota bacterium]